MTEAVPLRPRILSIAGSDPSGGAGIQADSRTILAHHCHPCTVITALTAQSPKRVTHVHPVPPESVSAQLTVILEDIPPAAIKTGMLVNTEVIEAVSDTLAPYPNIPLILDPVMIATSGAKLLADDAVRTITERLFPQATLITPNIPEAEALSGIPVTSPADMEAAARHLQTMGARQVLLKGGHLTGDKLTDILLDEQGNLHIFTDARLPHVDTHGTGCRLASAIACQIGKGVSTVTAVTDARTWLRQDMLAA